MLFLVEKSKIVNVLGRAYELLEGHPETDPALLYYPAFSTPDIANPGKREKAIVLRIARIHIPRRDVRRYRCSLRWRPFNDDPCRRLNPAAVLSPPEDDRIDPAVIPRSAREFGYTTRHFLPLI